MSLTHAYDPDNIFAKMLRGEIPNITVYEDEDVLSFMDIFPQAEGHTLVIPKKDPTINLLQADPSILATLIQRTQMIGQAMEQALKPDGIRLMQFNGEAAGQTVYHLHFHLIPMNNGTGLRAHGAEPADTEALGDIAARIRACLP